MPIITTFVTTRSPLPSPPVARPPAVPRVSSGMKTVSTALLLPTSISH
jgi:hypothetical protein